MLRRQASALRASLVNYQRRGPRDASQGLRGPSGRIPGTVQTGAGLGLRGRLVQLRKSQLVRQNAILFAGGLTAGIGGFNFHAIAGPVLGTTIHRPGGLLIARYALGAAPALDLVLEVARCSATL